jgi:hypothetical protein
MLTITNTKPITEVSPILLTSVSTAKYLHSLGLNVLPLPRPNGAIKFDPKYTGAKPPYLQKP